MTSWEATPSPPRGSTIQPYMVDTAAHLPEAVLVHAKICSVKQSSEDHIYSFALYFPSNWKHACPKFDAQKGDEKLALGIGSVYRWFCEGYTQVITYGPLSPFYVHCRSKPHYLSYGCLYSGPSIWYQVSTESNLNTRKDIVT